MRPLLLVLSILAVAVSGNSSPTFAQASSSGGRIQDTTPRDWTVQVVSDDLDYPWAIARSGTQLLLTEKAGNVVVIEGGRQQRYRLQTSDSIVDEGGAGLLGMALAPNFAQSGTAYFYHSYRSNGGLTNKVIEARFDGRVWRETRVLLAGIPGHRLYNGGRVALGPDGHLYVTTGWTANRGRPQDLGSLAGKVLRMTLSGQVPQGNPFSGYLVYSYGHRNPQGMAWNPAGELYVAEHGESGHDEINRIRPGANYGWPLAQGAEQREGLGSNRVSALGRQQVLRSLATSCSWPHWEHVRCSWSMSVARQPNPSSVPAIASGMCCRSSKTSMSSPRTARLGLKAHRMTAC